eukprot:2155791-Pyramimonas_sp.AAC.1
MIVIIGGVVVVTVTSLFLPNDAGWKNQKEAEATSPMRAGLISKIRHRAPWLKSDRRMPQAVWKDFRIFQRIPALISQTS